jgi:hypothetical protein
MEDAEKRGMRAKGFLLLFHLRVLCALCGE